MVDKYREPLDKMTTPERCRFLADLLSKLGYENKPGTTEYEEIMVLREAADKLELYSPNYDPCKDCYPELGYKNDKAKRDLEAIQDFARKLAESEG